MTDKIDQAFIGLHQRWQETLAAMMLEDAASQKDCFESMLTVALAAKLRAEGTVQVARALLFIGNGLTKIAAETKDWPHQLH
jgi:hypothetical protein